MGPLQEALREKFSPSLFGGEEITANFRKILGHSVKYGSLGIPDPQQSAEFAYNIVGTSRDSYIGRNPLPKLRTHKPTRTTRVLQTVVA